MPFPFWPLAGIGSVWRAVNVIKLSYLQFNASPFRFAAVACSYPAFASCKIASSVIKLPSVPRVIAPRNHVTRKRRIYTADVLHLVASASNRKANLKNTLIYCQFHLTVYLF